MLIKHHGMAISLRKLKRRLIHFGLSRERNTSTSVRKAIIERELAWYLDYREIWSSLHSSYSIKVPRDEVMRLLKVLHPIGTAERRV